MLIKPINYYRNTANRAIGLRAAMSLAVCAVGLVGGGARPPTGSATVRLRLGYFANITQAPALVGINYAAHLVLFRFGPERRAHMNVTVWPGAVVSTGLWTLGSVLLTLYFQTFATYDALFGSLAGVAIVMFWFYAMTLFTLFGAKLNARM